MRLLYRNFFRVDLWPRSSTLKFYSPLLISWHHPIFKYYMVWMRSKNGTYNQRNNEGFWGRSIILMLNKLFVCWVGSLENRCPEISFEIPLFVFYKYIINHQKMEFNSSEQNSSSQSEVSHYFGDYWLQIFLLGNRKAGITALNVSSFKAPRKKLEYIIDFEKESSPVACFHQPLELL